MCSHFQIAPIRSYAQRKELANSNYECKYTCPRDIKDREDIDFLRTPLVSAHHTVTAHFFNIPGKTVPPPTPYLRPRPLPGHTADPLHAVVFQNAATIWQHQTHWHNLLYFVLCPCPIFFFKNTTFGGRAGFLMPFF
jgi:hypothetical protein